jgi:hypothetical protein
MLECSHAWARHLIRLIITTSSCLAGGTDHSRRSDNRGGIAEPRTHSHGIRLVLACDPAIPRWKRRSDDSSLSNPLETLAKSWIFS